MTAVESSCQWQILGRMQSYPGYIHGCRYPALVLGVEGSPLPTAASDGLAACLADACPTWTPPVTSGTVEWRESINWLLDVWQTLPAALGLPVYEKGRILSLGVTQARCVVPMLAHAHRALAELVQSSVAYLASHGGSGDKSAAETLSRSIERMRTHSARGSNVPRFVKAAYELQYPIRLLPGGAYQYGTGHRARWLDSSFTDVTPNLSARLARSKVWAAELLRNSGLPVPAHQVVHNAEAAKAAAIRLGYPVVVKPADLDGGTGVAAGLETEEEVVHAFAIAQKHSKLTLVEKHVQGRDYRVTVFNGEAIWAIERVPGGVNGDGQHSIAELVDQLNTDVRRGTSTHSPLKALVIDTEAMQLMKRQGLTTASVPATGHFVRLRRAANVASGGTPVAVFDQIHPDNARLAVRAAEALRLDLAGVDLLIPDIAVSWRESSAFICEVNGQPNLGQTTAAHLYAPILQQLVEGSGRVPTVVILGAAEPEVWVNAVAGALSARGWCAGSVGPQGVRLGEEWLTTGGCAVHTGGQMLALNRSTEAIVLAINDDECMRTGIPVERYDALLLAGTNLQPSPSGNGSSPDRWASALIASLLPGCDGVVITDSNARIDTRRLADHTNADQYTLSGSAKEVAFRCVELVAELAAQRGDFARVS